MINNVAVRMCAIVAATLSLTAAALAHPGAGIVVTSDGTIYFAHPPGSRIWKITPDGRAEPFVTGGLDQSFRVPHALILDGADGLITASDAGSIIWRISLDGSKSQIYPPQNWDGVGSVALGGDPFTLAPDGRIISIVDESDATDRLVIIDRDSTVTPLAGGAPRHTDGRGGDAGFSPLHMSSFAWGPGGDLYMTEAGAAVRRVTLAGEVTTLAGGTETGRRDGNGREARFDGAMGLTVAPDGTIFVAGAQAHRIRRIAPDRQVTTWAGSAERGSADGPAETATFDMPVGITRAADGSLYVLEYAYGDAGEFVRVRRISADGQVTTVAILPAERLDPKK